MREREAWLCSQREALETALTAAPLEMSLGVLVRSATDRLSEGARAAFYLANPEGTKLHHVVGMSAAYAEAVDGFQIGPESLACGLATHTGLPILTTHVTKEPLWTPWLGMAEAFDYRGCWSFPIHTAAGKFVGTFAIYSRQPREATPRDVDFAGLVTQTAAIIIARHIDAELRKAAEEALREREERYELVLTAAEAAIWDWDVPRKRIDFAPGWKRLRGLSDGEVSDREEEWSRGIHPDDCERVVTAVQAQLEGRTPVFAEEYRVRHKDGHWVWVMNRGAARRTASGQVIRMAGSETDISERELAQEDCRKSNKRSRQR